MEDFKCGNTYLSRYSLSFIGLRTLGENELLAIDVFAKPLLELLYIGMVTGLEVYLQDRLSKEVFSSDEKVDIYVKEYNKRNKRRTIKVSTPLNDEDHRTVEDTVQNKQVCHRIPMMMDYFKKISGFNSKNCRSADSIGDIIKIRHALVHRGGKLENGEMVHIGYADVENTRQTIYDFILEVETEFQRLGSDWLFEIAPDQ